MQKILFVITQGELGGAQKYVFDLATNLPKDEFECVVAQGPEDLTLKEKLEALGIKTFVLPHLTRAVNPWNNLLARSEIKKLIKQEKPGIVHANSSMAGFLAAQTARSLGVKNVYTAHGWVFKEPGALSPFYKILEKSASKSRDKIICVSEQDRRLALQEKIAPDNKFVTIHNGIDLSLSMFTRVEARQKLSNLLKQQVHDDNFVFGTIASNYATKDLPTLFKAAELVQTQIPNAKFIVIGKGSQIGPVADAYKLLPGFDTYAMSSVKEGLPYALLQDLQAGVPIVSTNVGGIPEIITDNQEGFLVSPKRPEQLANKIIQLAQDPELRTQMSLAALKRASAFSLNEMLQQTIKIYQSI